MQLQLALRKPPFNNRLKPLGLSLTLAVHDDIIGIPFKEAADDTIFWVNADSAKKKGYPVELIITRVGDIATQPKEPAKESTEKQKGEGPETTKP